MPPEVAEAREVLTPANEPAQERPTAPVRLSPVQFAVAVLGLRLYVWQARVLADVMTGTPTAVVTPNGAGKTSVLISALALTVLHEWPGATVVLTSATFRAVRTQIFAALEQHRAKFPNWTWKDTEITDANCGRILGFATDQGAKFEGFHAHPDRPLLIILDEAKTVQDDIFVAADRCNPTYLLYVSSPGGNFGQFHDAFKNSGFHRHHITAKDCPHLSEEWIAKMREKYGEGSDVFRSMVLGQFAKGNEQGKIVQFADYERCLAQPPPWAEGQRQAFCDFAESGDLCVIATRDGNRLQIADAWQPDGDVARVAARFETGLRPLHEAGYILLGDADGTGHGFITTLKLRGLPIRGVKNNSAASDSHYFNLVAQQWWTFAKQVASCRWILPHDETLKRQLCERNQNYVERDGQKIFGREDGRLQLQPKRREKGASPNHADAIVGAAFDYPTLEAVPVGRPAGGRETPEFPHALPSRWEQAERELRDAEKMAGCTWD
jgi:phage terminase large subunit